MIQGAVLPDTPAVTRLPPKVTALLPCYNAAEFISSTLECLDAQTWTNLEILIGDDGSTDATPDLVEKFAKARPHARLIRRQSNQGWLRNSNGLMAEASGEMMFFAFHDDLLAPSYAEKLAGALMDDPGAVLAYSDLELIDLDGTTSIWAFDDPTGPKSRLSRGLVMCGRRNGWWVPNRGMFRSWAFRRIGGIKPNEKGEYSADWTWLLRMSLLGGFVRVPAVLCRKFYKKGSLSKTWPHDRAQRRALIRAGIREIRESSLGVVEKSILMAYLSNELHGRPVDRLPGWAKGLLKTAMGIPGSKHSL
jgi:glycosyltransferase involved in cell wall biosynthesis